MIQTTFVNGINPFRQAPLPRMQPEVPHPSELQRVAAAMRDGPRTARQLMARLDITSAKSMGGYLLLLTKTGAIQMAPHVEGLPKRRFVLVNVDLVPPDTVRRVVAWIADNPHKSKAQLRRGLGLNNTRATEFLALAVERQWAHKYDVVDTQGRATSYYTAI